MRVALGAQARDGAPREPPDAREAEAHRARRLGATPAQALLGRSFKVTKQRGRFLDSGLAPLVMATVHPSAVLRAGARREEARRAFVADLNTLARALDAR